MFYLLLGLTGVGKTTLGMKAETELRGVKYLSLDEIIKKKDPVLYYNTGTRWKDFLKLAKEQIKILENLYSENIEIYFCDVGAGCLKTDEGFDYFSKKNNTILILDKPENVFQRVSARPNGPWQLKSFEELVNSKCSSKWNKISSNAKFKFDIEGLPEEIAIKKFIEFTRSLKKES